MVLLICVLISAGFAYYAIKHGFYETWALTFNIVISVYVAIFLSPMILEMMGKKVNESNYTIGMVLLGVAILVFALLHGISFTFLTGQFRITLPKIVDWVGSGVAGVAAGIVVWSFLGFFILTLPFSSGRIDKKNGMIHDLDVSARPCLVKICGIVDMVMPFENKDPYSVDELLSCLVVRRDDDGKDGAGETVDEEVEAYESVFENAEDN